MKKIFSKFIYILLALSIISCEDYLDKSIETDLTKEEVFKNFNNAQGFVEEMYGMVVDHGLAMGWSGFFNFGDDAIGNIDWQFDYHLDMGRYWKWQNDYGSIFSKNNGDTSNDLALERHGIWQSSWSGIRKANMVIDNIDLMTDATQEERDVILGQAYFFRAYFHNEIMQYWGRIPYIDEVISGNDWRLPRPATYKEVALQLDQDYEQAAELLPVDWDDHPAGQRTKGQNKLRVSKGAAYAFKGKNLLIAASPLMIGASNTYDYDTELCAKAADAFAEVLKLEQQGRYQLANFENYKYVFYSYSPVTGFIYPGATEYIFSSSGNTAWFMPFMADNFHIQPFVDRWDTQFPTHNYVHNNFGMADGLSCDDSPAYDPMNPFEGRDPRLYEWVILDGDQLVKNPGAAPEKHRYAQFYEGGTHRKGSGGDFGSLTGYICKKYFGQSFNKFEERWAYLPFRINMRLTDVYLMYAESAHAAYGSQQSPSSFNLTAEQAINILRDRAGVGQVQFASDNNKFMDEIRRERAVELSWEGFRLVDIRRWLLAEQMEYREKTGLDFDKEHTYFNEVVLRTKVFDEKHYWFPFPQGDVDLYSSFTQNPGW